jgi:HK97 family phage portal protein
MTRPRSWFDKLFRRGSAKDSFATVSFGAPETAAGVTVTPETAHTLPTVYACVRILTNSVAMLPLKLYRRRDDGGREEATGHPLFDVLHRAANAEMTAPDLLRTIVHHLLLYGHSYCEILRDDSGRVTALWPLFPPAMRVERDSDRRLRFSYYLPTGRPREWRLDPSRPPLLRLTINSLDGGVTGRSPIELLRESLGLARAQQTFAASFFKNSSVFGGVLSTDQDLDDEQAAAIQRNIERLHKSADKAHRFLVLGAGFKFTPFGMRLSDAQFLESRRFSRDEICAAFGVPPVLLGDVSGSSQYRTVADLGQHFLTFGLEPLLSQIEAAIDRDLIGPRSGGRYYARFTRQALVRMNLRERTAAFAVMRQHGVLSADEWRELEDMNPLPGGLGRQYVTLSAMPAPADEDDRDASSGR